jgi:hypothetical protein
MNLLLFDLIAGAGRYKFSLLRALNPDAVLKRLYGLIYLLTMFTYNCNMSDLIMFD